MRTVMLALLGAAFALAMLGVRSSGQVEKAPLGDVAAKVSWVALAPSDGAELDLKGIGIWVVEMEFPELRAYCEVRWTGKRAASDARPRDVAEFHVFPDDKSVPKLWSRENDVGQDHASLVADGVGRRQIEASDDVVRSVSRVVTLRAQLDREERELLSVLSKTADPVSLAIELAATGGK